MRSIISVMMVLVSLSCVSGCGRSSNPATATIRKLFQPSPDTDVTSLPRYNFSSFSGTVWRTKGKTAIADLKRYTGAHDITLLIPKYFDSSHPDYMPVRDMQMVAVLPAGSRITIERLTQDNGAWGGLMVTATVENGSDVFKNVHLNEFFLANNSFIMRGPTTSTSWDVNPEFLEKP